MSGPLSIAIHGTVCSEDRPLAPSVSRSSMSSSCCRSVNADSIWLSELSPCRPLTQWIVPGTTASLNAFRSDTVTVPASGVIVVQVSKVGEPLVAA